MFVADFNMGNITFVKSLSRAIEKEKLQ